jgi:hypothetical protein
MRPTAFLPLFALGLPLLAGAQLSAQQPNQPVQYYMTLLRQQVGDSDCVVVGKVKAIEEKTVLAGTLPNDIYHFEHKVAVIAVEEAIRGTGEQREVRVAFRAVHSTDPRFTKFELAVNQQACFVLKHHHEMDFYVATRRMSKEDANYERDLAEVRRAARCFADPLAALKCKDAADHLVAAELLITRYRGAGFVGAPAGKRIKVEPIDADESRLILLALADADWTPNINSPLPVPAQLFTRLGVTLNDGFVPANFANFNEAAKAWAKENAETYRIKRITIVDAPKK